MTRLDTAHHFCFKWKLSIVFVPLLSSTLVFGQMKILKPDAISLNLTRTTLREICLGFEYKAGKRSSILLELDYKIPKLGTTYYNKFGVWSIDAIDHLQLMHGPSLGINYRLYAKSNSGFYISPGIVLKHIGFNSKIYIHIAGSEANTYSWLHSMTYDNAVGKLTWGLKISIPKVERQKVGKLNFNIDFYMGGGIKFRYQSQTLYGLCGGISHYDPTQAYIYDPPKKSHELFIRPSVHLGLRIGVDIIRV